MFYALHVSIAYFQFYIISSKVSKAFLRKTKSEKADYLVPDRIYAAFPEHIIQF